MVIAEPRRSKFRIKIKEARSGAVTEEGLGSWDFGLDGSFRSALFLRFTVASVATVAAVASVATVATIAAVASCSATVTSFLLRCECGSKVKDCHSSGCILLRG